MTATRGRFWRRSRASEKTRSGDADNTERLPQTRYAEALRILEEKDRAGKLALAQSTDVAPEILYYLASDEATAVRQMVAANPTTPHQAHKILARDDSLEVREELARKIARLLPDSSQTERAATRERLIEILETLAQDQATVVRKIIAEELKSSLAAPHALIRRLAEDGEYPVCAPVLEYSPLLSDDDLKEIIALTKVKGALSAIARRAAVSAEVADRIAASLDVPAVATLLANPNASIREETLDRIIDHAADVTDWHEPLAKRPNLSLRLMRRIAGFVATSLVEEMVRRQDITADAAEMLLNRVRQRLQEQAVDAEEAANRRQAMQQLYARGALDEQFVIDALDRRQREVVIQALALLAMIDMEDARRIITRRNPQRITALVWKAGLSMRTAFRIQSEVALVPHRQLLFARNGFDYPLSEAQMTALLEPYLA